MYQLSILILLNSKTTIHYFVYKKSLNYCEKLKKALNLDYPRHRSHISLSPPPIGIYLIIRGVFHEMVERVLLNQK